MAQKIDCLLTHHPVFFRPLKRLQAEDPWQGLIIRLLREGVSVVSYHTNLDVAPGGVTEVLAETLGLSVEEALKPVSEDLKQVGLGRIGNLEKALKISILAQRLSQRIGAPVFQVGPDREVRRVALCAGSGGDLLPQVLSKGAELYITGEIKHHAARDMETLGLSLLVSDHFALEAYYFEHHLFQQMRSDFPSLKISYYPGQSPFQLVISAQGGSKCAKKC